MNPWRAHRERREEREQPHTLPLVPLRDRLDLSDPNECLGAALLSKVPPLEPSAARRHRVWLAMPTRQTGPHATWLRPSRLVPALVLLATAASAGVGRYWSEQSEENARHEIASMESSPEAKPVAQRAKALLAKPDPADALAEDAAELEETDDGEEAAGDFEHAASPRPHLRALKRSGAPARNGAKGNEPSKSTAPDPEAALLLEAMRARRSGDSAKAGELLSEYREKHPRGALQEEALALSIEAAAARSDPAASRLARQYLNQYPKGRFRPQALRALRPAEP